ncbi:MAG: hypothetical protein ACI381_02735, partial [Candidatus Methanomethylophilaceae archaeon]
EGLVLSGPWVQIPSLAPLLLHSVLHHHYPSTIHLSVTVVAIAVISFSYPIPSTISMRSNDGFRIIGTNGTGRM